MEECLRVNALKPSSGIDPIKEECYAKYAIIKKMQAAGNSVSTIQ